MKQSLFTSCQKAKMVRIQLQIVMSKIKKSNTTLDSCLPAIDTTLVDVCTIIGLFLDVELRATIKLAAGVTVEFLALGVKVDLVA